MGGFQRHHLAVLDPPLYGFTQALTLEIRFVAHCGFILLFAVGGLVATSLTAVQAALVTGLELCTTDRTVLFINLPGNVLVLVSTKFTTKNAAQLLERLQTVLALGARRGLQTDVRLVPLHRLVTASRTEFMVDTALRKERRTVRTLDLLWCPALVVPDAPAAGCFVIAIMITILRSAVAVVEHPFALCTAFHCLCALFTAYILGATFHAAMPVGLVAWRELFPAPGAGLWKVDPILFTGQGGPFADRNDRPCYRIPKAVAWAFCSCRKQDNTAVWNRDMSRECPSFCR